MPNGEICEHVSGGKAKRFTRVTARSTGAARVLCRQCFVDFIVGKGLDPREFIVGYHVYRSVDPKQHKKQWQRLTDSPITEMPYKDPPPPQGVNYYYYVTVVNAYGVEGNPSNVIESGEGEWNIPPVSDLEM